MVRELVNAKVEEKTASERAKLKNEYQAMVKE